MNPALAGVAGAAVVLGLYVVVVGWRGSLAPRRTRPLRRRRLARPVTRTAWSRWRWPLALAAGVAVAATTRWPVVAILAAVGVVGLPVLLGTDRVAASRIDRVEAIEEWTRRLADVLLTGVGLEQAITTTSRTAPASIAGEVGVLVARLTARWSTEDALRAFADDLDDPAGDLIVAALLLAARRRGPGLASVLTSVAGAVADDVAARRRIEAERAKPRTTARLVTLITLGVVGVGAVNGTYLAPYGTPLGQVVLGTVAAGFIACLAWMRRLTLPPPEARFLTGSAVAR